LGGFSGNNNPSAWIANQKLDAADRHHRRHRHPNVALRSGRLRQHRYVNYTLTPIWGSYAFNNVSVPNFNTQLETFFGYTAGPGEYSAGLALSRIRPGQRSGLDNVTLAR